MEHDKSVSFASLITIMNILAYYKKAFPNTTAAIEISSAASTLSTLAADLLRAPGETERILATINEVVAELNKTSEALVPADSPATVIADPLAACNVRNATDHLTAGSDQSESITVSASCGKYSKLTIKSYKSVEESSESSESWRSFKDDHHDGPPDRFDELVSQAVVNLYGDFKNLCPFTLLYGAPCPLGNRCTLQRVCLDYIKRVLDGNGASQCQNKACLYPHIRLTCPHDFGGKPCEMLSMPTYKQGVPYLAHMTMYQHLTDDEGHRTGSGEVQSRFALLELIKPHLRGGYTIKDTKVLEEREE